MKKMIIVLIIFLITLSACVTQTTTSDGSILRGNPATAKATASEAISPTDQLLERYLAGEAVDTSALSPTECSEFSRKLAKKLNRDRGINPIIYNNEAYISPYNYMMMDYDGHPDQYKTITMFHPIEGSDAEGNLQISVNNKIITIPNSADMDWTIRITDPTDSRIDWPTTGITQENLTNLQYRINDNRGILLPVVLADKEFGQVYINSEKQQMMASSLSIMVIETDAIGNPILARQIIAISGPTMRLLEEGSPLEVGDGPVMNKENSFYKSLNNYDIYFLCIPTDQDRIYEKGLFAAPENYKGLVSGNNAFSILNDEIENNKDMLLLTVSVLVKKK